MPKAEAQAALQAALARGGRPDQEVWDIWLWSGADINSVCAGSGKTALMIAAERGEADAIAYLLARGAKVDTANPHNGMTALMYAASHGLNTHCVAAQLLLDKGCDPDLRDHAGQSAIDKATPAGEMHQLLAAAWIAKNRDRHLARSAYGQRRQTAGARFKLG